MNPTISGSTAGAIRYVWSRRRWLYASYLLFAITRIPARTGFHLTSPACDTRLTVENIVLSLTKVPHMVLFGIFFFLTVMQFDRLDGRTMLWSLLATLGLGLLVEVQEGATRTGNCRMTDVLPDLLGALIVAVLLIGVVLMRRRLIPSNR